MANSDIKIPPRPKLFQWYHHTVPGKYEGWDIWVKQSGTVLWGFAVYPDSKADVNNTNLRYWDEKDFPWQETVDKGETTKESKTPKLDDGSKLLILQTIFSEDHGENSKWFNW